MMLNRVQIWCGASALCDILIAICMTYYASSFSISVVFIDADPIFVSLCVAIIPVSVAPEH